MGLLDGNLDPQSMATMQLAAGLLSPGSFGQGLGKGLSGYQGTLANSQDMQIKHQQLEMAKLQFAAQMRNQNLINNAIEQGMGDQGAPQQQPGQPSVMAGMGQQPPSISSPGNPTMGGQAPQQGGPRMMLGAPAAQTLPDLMFNGGKGIGKMVQDYHMPISMRPNAFGVSPDGKTTHYPTASPGNTIVSDGNGGWMEKPIPGGLGAVAQSSAAQAAGPAGFKTRKMLGPDNQEYEVFNKDLPNFAPGAGAPAPGAAHDTSQVSTGGSGAIDPTTTTGGTSGRPQTGATSAPAAPFGSSQTTNGNGGITAPVPGGPLLAQPRSMQTAVLNDIQKSGAKDATVNGMPLEAASAPVGIAGALRTGFAPGVLEGAKNSQDLMKTSYQDVMRGAQPAATVQARLDEIAKFSKTAIMGGDTQWRDFANNLLSIAGVSERATDRKTSGDLLEKNAAQISLAIGTGANGTDGLRALAASANPGRHMTTDAVQQAVGQLQASAQVAQAKAQLMTPHFNAGNTGAYNTTEQTFDKNADYRVFQIINDTKGMSGPQINAYFQSKGYTPAQVRQFSAQKGQLQGMGVQF